jgi:hypothetical protein
LVRLPLPAFTVCRDDSILLLSTLFQYTVFLAISRLMGAFS